MCGIVGYIGKRQAYPVLIKGLKRLEYRGYDSAGVALITESSGRRFKEHRATRWIGFSDSATPWQCLSKLITAHLV